MIQGYRPKQTGHTKIHKKEELKKIYEDILKASANSGYYKFQLSSENQRFTIDIKESALLLKTKLQELRDPLWSGYHSKKAWVSNPMIAEASLMKEPEDSLPENMQIVIKQLADFQENVGTEYYSRSNSLDHGIYDFSIKVRGKQYNLSFHQMKNGNNEETMSRLAEYINSEVADLDASVEYTDKESYIQMVLRDKYTGQFGDQSFTVEESDLYRNGIVHIFGLSRVMKEGANAVFTINGIDQVAPSNTFHVENTIRVTLKSISETPLEIKLLRDEKVIFKEVDSVLKVYNDLLETAIDRTGSYEDCFSASKLVHELRGLVYKFNEELEKCGIVSNEDGFLERDTENSEITIDEMDGFITKHNGFITALIEKSEQIAINPLEYLEKIIVTYSNHKAKINPYLTSLYSGLFFNSYC